jgi:hypothetical protein
MLLVKICVETGFARIHFLTRRALVKFTADRTRPTVGTYKSVVYGLFLNFNQIVISAFFVDLFECVKDLSAQRTFELCFVV